MSYDERKQWIINYLKSDRFGMVGASDLDFLEAFANAHMDELQGLKHTDDACMRTIRRMYKEGLLYRKQHNMQGWETPSGYGAHTYLYGLKEDEPKPEPRQKPTEYKVLARYNGGFPFMTKKE